jgi:hypothetical integral membrane protein (TIGR02206 family)
LRTAPAFTAFSISHLLALSVLGIIGYFLIRTGRRSDDENQLNIAIVIAGLTLSTEIIEVIVLNFLGRYEWRADLPLFLCDLTAVFLPFVLLKQNRKWLGILYFWSMAGTVQALITPELDEGFPSFEFLRYFTMHGGIVIAMMYCIIVFRIRIHWKDFTNAIFYAQVYLIAIHVFNEVFRTNYSYTLQKPAGTTVLDYFGPWPWYLLWGEVLMIALFLILMLPFKLSRRSEEAGPTETFGIG